jgi:hypothetical protein
MQRMRRTEMKKKKQNWQQQKLANDEVGEFGATTTKVAKHQVRKFATTNVAKHKVVNLE